MNQTSSEDFRETFFQECDELLETLNDGFSALGTDFDDIETLHAIFRAVHSIKGGASAFGLDNLVAFAHRFETGLDAVRSGEVSVTDDLLVLFQRCGDHLSDQVAAARGDGAIEAAQSDALCETLTEMTGATGPEAVEEVTDFQPATLDFSLFGDIGSEDEVETGHLEATCFTFQASADLFKTGNEPATLLKALERYGPVSVSAILDEVPLLSGLHPEVPHMTWIVTIDAAVDEADVREVFEFVDDCATLTFIDRQVDPGDSGRPAASGEDEPENADEPETQKGPTSAEDPSEDAEVASSGKIAAPPAAHSRNRTPSTIRVDLDRVDKLINLVGELVIKEAMLSQSITELGLPSQSDVASSLASLKQLASEIQEGVMAIRAQPIKPVFQRMARTVRDASLATGKRVNLVTHGEYTEVDKTVLERLVDPLTHMIRNAVDHGLEDAEGRKSAGKAEEGTVTLSAAHRSGRVVIEISDDGAGINRPNVRKIAEDKGLISPNAEMTPSEIDSLLFLPGFSSKEEVSELSGRGVGLDVARNEILSLGGRLTIQSNPGFGTTFSISLPLTLAVLEGMVIDVAGETMVVPITAVHETQQPKASSVHAIGTNAQVLATRDGLLPIIDLGNVFGLRSAPDPLDNHILLIVETEARRRCALLVDAIRDQRQVVIKSLETNYQHIDGIAAATILGDGRIALIIDPESIVARVGPSVVPAPEPAAASV
ncbi:chemotaxis protein CheA [Rhodobacterales bacterium HKCCE4037]|nr:chemotaxis protein CheA [Rhodobacterales bacterium HKCCE4037]